MAEDKNTGAGPKDREVRVTSTATLQRQEINQPRPAPSAGVSVQRPARTLIGWMNPIDARLSLAGRNQNERDRPEFQQIVDDARRAVTGRVAGLDQKRAVSHPPEMLADYIRQLQQNPASAQYFAEGWVVRIADLRHICSFQPHVFTEDAAQRVAAVEPGDLGAIARNTAAAITRPHRRRI